MRGPLHRRTLERAVQGAIVATILTAVLSAGAILAWLGPARALRWVALAALAALAVAYARTNRAPRQPVAVFAAAGAFVGLCLVSALWSATPLVTAARALSLALLLVAAGALAYGSAGRTESMRRVLDAVLAGIGAVAVGGLLVLAFRHDRAVEPATTALPARYQGLGGGPDTATMVLAVGVPLAAYVLVAASRPLVRVGAGALLLLLVGSIVASGSRGALLAAFAGLLVYALVSTRSARRRALAAAAVAAAFVVALALTRLPKPARPAAAPAAAARAELVSARPRYLDANEYLRLQDDIGHPLPGVADTTSRPRTIFGTSGRAEAWQGALEQAAKRPLVGFGFGTESRVFVERYVGFESNLPENSYIGLFLQLGIVGLAVFLALPALLVVRAVRAPARLDPARLRLAAACAGGLGAGLVLALFQSYIYSAGNNASAAVWICGFLLAAATIADGPLRHR